MLAIWSLVPLSFLNPDWTSGSSWFKYCWGLAWRILSTTLLSCEISAIVRWQENLLNMRCYQSLSTSVLPGKSPVGPKLVERNSETRPNCSSAYTEAVGAACPYFLRNQRDTSVSCTIWHAVHSKIHTTRAVHSSFPTPGHPQCITFFFFFSLSSRLLSLSQFPTIHHCSQIDFVKCK